MKFREFLPVRRDNPKQVRHYSQHKDELREDFHKCCGYCGDSDYFRMEYYEVDHFAPKEVLETIALTDYSNLVYSCRSCNNSKRATWPTGDEHVHNDGKVGFIDPCNADYDQQFERNADGSIVPTTPLGEWMFSALNLGNPKHRIIWMLMTIKEKIESLKSLDLDVLDARQSRAIIELYQQYVTLENTLRK